MERVRAELEPLSRLVALGRSRALALNTRLEQLSARQRVLDDLVQRAARAATAARTEALQEEDDEMEVGLACAELQALVLKDMLDEMNPVVSERKKEYEREEETSDDDECETRKEDEEEEEDEDTPEREAAKQYRDAQALGVLSLSITRL